MRKDSPVEKFPGYVVLPDYLNLPQVRAFESALGDLNQVARTEDERVWFSVIAEKRLPVIFACISEWHLEGIPDKPTEDTFPMTPIVPANDLVNWLFDEIRQIWIGEVADPKE